MWKMKRSNDKDDVYAETHKENGNHVCSDILYFLVVCRAESKTENIAKYAEE